MTAHDTSLYERIGGEATFHHLVDVFYNSVDLDPAIRQMFPEDLAGAKERLALFLIQYFGGPTTYDERRGHPRLRMRHVPFAIDRVARDHWVAHMLEAIDAVGIAEPERSEMIEYFERGATFMINQSDERGRPLSVRSDPA